MSGYGTEQPVCLAVDPVGEVQDIGAAVVALDPEGEGPEAASRVAAGVDRDRPMQLSVARDKGIDLAMAEAEVADQHIIAEPAETGRCDGNPPGAARRLPETSSRMKLPSSSKIATTPCPKAACLMLSTPAGA